MNQIIESNRNIGIPASAVNNLSGPATTSLQSSIAQSVPYTVWTWEGKLRPFPQDYNYPKKVPLKTMHDLWYEGVPSLSIRPFKFIKGTMLHNRVEAQAQCRAKSLVTEINKYLVITDYLAQSAALRDSAFKTAFSSMVLVFSTECETIKIADHSISYTTLYEKFYLPFNKKRKLT